MLSSDYNVLRSTVSALNNFIQYSQGFLWCFRDPIRVPRIENRIPRIRENYHRLPEIRGNRVPRVREIGSLQVHTGYLTFSLKILSTAIAKLYNCYD